MAFTVYLSPSDEVASIKAKMEKATDNPVVVVAPKSVKALRDPLALKLLQRHARFLGKDLVLVASDRIVRHLAGYHGLASFSSVTQVRRWHPSDKPQGRTNGSPFLQQRSGVGLSGFGIGLFVLLVVVLPLIAGYFLIPSATINLSAVSTRLSETAAITVSTDTKSVDPDSRTIPGRIVETQLEFTDQTDIAGKKPMPDAVATGQVTFMNKVGPKVTVPKGAILSTKSGVRFRTGDEAILPATQWSSVRVGIIADQPGKVGNVDKLAIELVVDSLLANQIAVVNENPTQGGTDKEVGAVTTQDRDRLETQALAKAKNALWQKLMETKKPSESIYRETLTTQLIDKQFDRGLGEEAKTISVKLVVRGTGLAFEAGALNELMTRLIDKKIPVGMKVKDGLKVKPLGIEKWSERTVLFAAQADATAVTDLNEEQVKSQIAGKSKEEAEQYLINNLVLAGVPELRIEPDWISSIPRFGWRTKINLRVP
ncbi:MAG: baseplate J/gp47 family protein [Dehalococcoidia bacterium]|nr:baseplate J/gp47 family protein [Dehalococcoidia bacterium]